jgi:hypothetical protein
VSNDEKRARWVIKRHGAKEAEMVDFVSAENGQYTFEDVHTKESIKLAFGTFAVLTTGTAGDMGTVIEQSVLL